MMNDVKRAVYIAHYRKPPKDFHKQHFYVVLLTVSGKAVVRRLPMVPTEVDRSLPLECDDNVLETAFFLATAQHISELKVSRGRFDPNRKFEQVVSLTR